MTPTYLIGSLATQSLCGFITRLRHVHLNTKVADQGFKVGELFCYHCIPFIQHLFVCGMGFRKAADLIAVVHEAVGQDLSDSLLFTKDCFYFLCQFHVILPQSCVNLFIDHRLVVAQNAVDLFVEPRIAGTKRPLSVLMSGREIVQVVLESGFELFAKVFGVVFESGVELTVVIVEPFGQGMDDPLITPQKCIDLGRQLLVVIAIFL